MTDATGKLTVEDKAKLTAWFAKFGQPSPVCPICGDRNWSIADHLVQPVTLGPGFGVQLGGVSYPQAMLISKCGHTLFVNAVLSGIVPTDQAADTAKRG